jgi:hypothetical protein
LTTEQLTSLRIHKLTKAQYDKAAIQGILEPGSLYLTPEEPLDLSAYLLKTDAEEKYLTNVEAEIIRTNHAGGTKVSLNG